MMILFPVKSCRSSKRPRVIPKTAEMNVEVMAMIKVTFIASSAPTFAKKFSTPVKNSIIPILPH
jgi:hypothetical protein